ncbi:MAG TPA: hypothetical protein PLX35_04245 [Cyclobacteriaceae bacterium]|nr:hypothetical protein [Cyclobacteriaceae bacterium]
MKSLVGIVILTVINSMAWAQYESGKKQSFIPAGWSILAEASGDLNKDSLVDLAVIVENPEEGDYGKPRALLILLKAGKTGDNYNLSCRSDQAILASGMGGTLGDPFTSMEIKNGVLRIDFDGGSRETFSTTHRYRYKDGAFYPIGATYTATDGPVSETFDYNISNGNIIVTKKDASNKANNKITRRLQKIIPPDLSRFDPDAIWAILMGSGVKVSNCVLKSAQSLPCEHLVFDCGDFGNADLYLDEASQNLWYSLHVAAPADDIAPNPEYEGKVFEIRYVEKKGIRCEDEGEAPYQLVIGIKLKN